MEQIHLSQNSGDSSIPELKSKNELQYDRNGSTIELSSSIELLATIAFSGSFDEISI
jgi:hypothetical protein